jgi:hypothetical protein
VLRSLDHWCGGGRRRNALRGRRGQHISNSLLRPNSPLSRAFDRLRRGRSGTWRAGSLFRRCLGGFSLGLPGTDFLDSGDDRACRFGRFDPFETLFEDAFDPLYHLLILG